MVNPSAPVIIRAYDPSDAIATARVVFDAVHQGTHEHYDASQRRAWMPAVPDLTTWRDRLAAQTAVVAVQGDACVGVMSLCDDGVLDLAFVAPEASRQGIGGRLYDAILEAARSHGLGHLTTYASVASQPFFAQRGWTVACDRQVFRNGVLLRSFAMYLPLIETNEC